MIDAEHSFTPKSHMHRRVPGFSFALLILAFLPARADQKTWTEVKSPHFRVITDASEHDARNVAAEFEQMRYVFASHFSQFRLESGAPLTIYAVRNYDSAKSLAPAIWKHNENVAGAYHPGWEKNFAIVRMDCWYTQEHWTVYHEYVHSVMHLNSMWLPTWMDEGMAEFYAFTRFQSDKTILGAPTARFAILRSRALIPVETLISVDGRSQILRDPQTTETFFADSWALVHYLTFGPNMKGGQLFNQFFSLLQQGMPQQQAFLKVFGDFKTFNENWSRYLNRLGFAAVSIPPTPHLDEKSFASRKLSVAETELELGAFHYAFHDSKTGEDLIAAALRDDPKLAAAHEEHAYALFHDGKDDQALAEFRQAYALDGTLYRSLFSKTMLSPEANATDSAGETAYRADLQKVTELNPQFAPAYVELAELAMRLRNYQMALIESRKAESLEPSRAGYHLLTGRILLASRHGADAAQFARFVAERWYGPDHDEAVDLWNAIPPAQRPADVTLTAHELEPNEQSATGTIETTRCGDADHPFTLTIAEDGKSQTYYRKGSFTWGFSDTLWWGEDHTTLCHHLEGKRAVVYYRPGSDSSFSGELTGFDVREN